MGMISDLWIKLSVKKEGFDKGLDDAKKKTGALSNGLSKLGNMIAGVFAVGAITGFVSSIVRTRAEFEKYEAVLTNTLGSQKQAKEEMRMLQEVASKTPFSLTELTGAYVKLVNYGLKPTKDEIIKLGDLASSTGKGFDQLTEAVADAVTGQYERLKEFGIKTSKEGSKVTFSFKEQKTAVDNNATSIKAYLLSLGELQGVQGAMASVSETLGGKISNLGDNWDKLLNTLGGASSGVFTTVISWLNSFIETLTWASKSIVDIKNDVLDSSTSSAMEGALKEIETIQQSLQKNGMSETEASKRAQELYYQSVETRIKELNKSRKEGTAALKQALVAERLAVQNHFRQLELDSKKNKPTTETAYTEMLKNIKKKQEELNAMPKKSIAFYEAEISLLEAKKQLITDPHLLAQSQSEIDIKKDMLEQLTGELKLLESKKMKLNDIRELVYMNENPNDKKDASKLDMGGSMKSGIQMSNDSIDAYEDQIQKAKAFTKELNSILASGLSEASTTMFTGFGEMLGSGDWDWSNFGSQILDTVGKFMQTLGGLFMTMGIGMIKFNASLKGMNGIGIIAAGALLVAAGAAISSVASQGMKGAGGSGASVASSYGSYSGSASNGIKIEVGGSFELEGTKLRAAIHNTERKNNLIR